MTARDTFNAAVSSANTTKANTVAAAETTRQATVDLQNSFQGYAPGGGPSNFSAFQSAVTSANQAKLKALNDAEVARQSAVAAARHTLQATGDTNPI